MENHSSVTGWQELFSHTNPSKFRWLLQSLPLRYTAENLQVTKFYYALSDCSHSNNFMAKKKNGKRLLLSLFEKYRYGPRKTLTSLLITNWTIFLEKMETDSYLMQRFIVGTTPALFRGRKEINSSFPPRR